MDPQDRTLADDLERRAQRCLTATAAALSASAHGAATVAQMTARRAHESFLLAAAFVTVVAPELTERAHRLTSAVETISALLPRR